VEQTSCDKEKFHLYKWEVDFTKEDFVIGLKKRAVRLIYFDAFAPEKQPEMWNDQLFKLLYVNMNKGEF
jgi:tRNA U34 5-methylaminomethyl-2-thiouridine-forming methyltransferase MnmC